MVDQREKAVNSCILRYLCLTMTLNLNYIRGQVSSERSVWGSFVGNLAVGHCVAYVFTNTLVWTGWLNTMGSLRLGSLFGQWPVTVLGQESFTWECPCDATDSVQTGLPEQLLHMRAETQPDYSYCQLIFFLCQFQFIVKGIIQNWVWISLYRRFCLR